LQQKTVAGPPLHPFLEGKICWCGGTGHGLEAVLPVLLLGVVIRFQDLDQLVQG
jgi:hypothetical protein